MNPVLWYRVKSNCMLCPILDHPQKTIAFVETDKKYFLTLDMTTGCKLNSQFGVIFLLAF
jgi:hypothetical protein